METNFGPRDKDFRSGKVNDEFSDFLDPVRRNNVTNTYVDVLGRYTKVRDKSDDARREAASHFGSVSVRFSPIFADFGPDGRDQVQAEPHLEGKSSPHPYIRAPKSVSNVPKSVNKYNAKNKVNKSVSEVEVEARPTKRIESKEDKKGTLIKPKRR